MKLPARIAKAHKHGRIKPRPVKCPEHLARVATMRCLVQACHYPATVHHVTGYADRAGRLARSDRLVVPLCPRHHQIQHGPRFSVEALGHRGFFRQYGIDLLAEAQRIEAESVALGVLSDG
jgi:hypothetical protein